MMEMPLRGLIVLAAALLTLAHPTLVLSVHDQGILIRGPGKVAQITIVGKLVHVAAIGGETTGWAVELEKEINFDGKKLRRIEVDPTTQEVTGFTDKRVEIKGRPTWIGGGPERGFYPIIEVASIRELSS